LAYDSPERDPARQPAAGINKNSAPLKAECNVSRQKNAASMLEAVHMSIDSIILSPISGDLSFVIGQEYSLSAFS